MPIWNPRLGRPTSLATSDIPEFMDSSHLSYFEIRSFFIDLYHFHISSTLFRSMHLLLPPQLQFLLIKKLLEVPTQICYSKIPNGFTLLMK
jgi:hypothetical protein